MNLARLERFELPTNWFEASYSIQLSYRRTAGANVPPRSPGGKSPLHAYPFVILHKVAGVTCRPTHVILREVAESRRQLTDSATPLRFAQNDGRGNGRSIEEIEDAAVLEDELAGVLGFVAGVGHVQSAEFIDFVVDQV